MKSSTLSLIFTSSAVLAVPSRLNNGGGGGGCPSTPYVACPDSRYNTPKCCTPDGTGFGYYCSDPTSTPTSQVDFEMDCADQGTTALCCYFYAEDTFVCNGPPAPGDF
ncbi:hypothetical protein M426DRAFT_28108 [Hypoxylon sp. CI-4A]|nr:hypothetical protein M426DRAFT_28108 [Hypoxylon sp. CI-4A]